MATRLGAHPVPVAGEDAIAGEDAVAGEDIVAASRVLVERAGES